MTPIKKEARTLYNKIVTKAKQHGEDSDPDHEVGDLQDTLHAALTLMTPNQVGKLKILLKEKEII
jgi:hypothetical protein